MSKHKKYRKLIQEFEGTKFQKKVWLAMMGIPKGETRTYSQLAKKIGRADSFRAVANACGKNPFAPHVPCHRVVGKNGLGGYSGKGGTRTKLKYLKKEGVDISQWI